jgi:hypothetical protein
MLNRPPTMFATVPEKYAAHPVPSLDEWENLWKVWDIVTRQMIPDEELNEKPIKLRNACIFYLGHIPTFLDMKIVEGTKLPPTRPTTPKSLSEESIPTSITPSTSMLTVRFLMNGLRLTRFLVTRRGFASE